MSDTDIVTRLARVDSDIADEAVAEIARLRSLNAEMVDALGKIGRMSTLPDDKANRMTLVAAHEIARAALTRATKEST